MLSKNDYKKLEEMKSYLINKTRLIILGENKYADCTTDDLKTIVETIAIMDSILDKGSKECTFTKV